MEIIDIGVEARIASGKGAARRTRRGGRIPAVVYRAGEEPINLSIDPAELELKMRKSGNRNAILRVLVDGSERLCLLKDIQRHPLNRRILHCDLYEVRKDMPVEVEVRVELMGRAIGARKGGIVNLVRSRLKVRCLPEAIPASVQLDVTELDVGGHIRVSEVQPPAGTQLLFERDFNVVVVTGALAEESEAPAEAAPAAAPATKS